MDVILSSFDVLYRLNVDALMTEGPFKERTLKTIVWFIKDVYVSIYLDRAFSTLLIPCNINKLIILSFFIRCMRYLDYYFISTVWFYLLIFLKLAHPIVILTFYRCLKFALLVLGESVFEILTCIFQRSISITIWSYQIHNWCIYSFSIIIDSLVYIKIISILALRK